jgi:hypothetical protein
MIEKIAKILRIEPYHLFKNQKINNSENSYPLLPKSMKTEIKNKIDISINEILGKY